MSHLKYASYPGFGEWNFENFHYSSAVRIPPGEQIQISGQGGWDRADGKVKTTLGEEYSQVRNHLLLPTRHRALTFHQAFENVDHAIKHAGGKGMASVYKLAVYYAPVSEEALNLTVENLRKWMSPSSADFDVCWGWTACVGWSED